MLRPGSVLGWLFDSRRGPAHGFVARWIFLRCLAAIYFSAFYSLIFQIKGLIGPRGVLPAGNYLAAVARELGHWRFWYAPSFFWISSNSHFLVGVMWVGLAASIFALLNLCPRFCFAVCFICFLSFVAASGDFSSYQSDGMLLEAGFLALFFAPAGVLPGLAVGHSAPRMSLFLLLWEWFRIYFESGMVKLLSGDPQWRHFTAMDEYYQNSPLPTWVGWYVEHLPHGVHAFATGGTLVMELGIVLLLFLGRRGRLVCFLIVTPWEILVILTGNYAFLNYLVLSLGFLLLDDRDLWWLLPKRLRPSMPSKTNEFTASTPATIWTAVTAILLTWIAYDTTAELVNMPLRTYLLPQAPIRALEPFRIANQYGLFAVMTRGRYEIEFQGSNDNVHWTAYPFQYKPQAIDERPGIYAPYQPRFDWNLWFASLGDWQQNQIVPLTEERLLEGNTDVLELFRLDPFPGKAPQYVRAVLWRYWFTTIEEKRRTGNWWRRELLGEYSPTMTRRADGKLDVVAWPGVLPEHD